MSLPGVPLLVAGVFKQSTGSGWAIAAGKVAVLVSHAAEDSSNTAVTTKTSEFSFYLLLPKPF